MEELLIEFSSAELEAIKKGNSKYGFPVVHICEKAIIFNAAASPIVPETIQWFTSPEYVIGLPAVKFANWAFKARTLSETFNSKYTCVPKAFEEKKIKAGYYKLYKYKSGFAFKRYEPLEE